MQTLFLIFIVLWFGCVVLGGWATTLLYRLNEIGPKTSVIKMLKILSRQSSCANCNTPINVFYTIPLIGRILTKNRCKTCHGKAPWNDLFTEISGGIWVWSWLSCGETSLVKCLILSALTWILMCLFVIRNQSLTKYRVFFIIALTFYTPHSASLLVVLIILSIMSYCYRSKNKHLLSVQWGDFIGFLAFFDYEYTQYSTNLIPMIPLYAVIAYHTITINKIPLNLKK